MNRERLKELLPIMQAYADGKEIQFLNFGNQWCDCGATNPRWADGVDYRIKPEVINVKQYVIIQVESGKVVRLIADEAGVQWHLDYYQRFAPMSDFIAVELTGSYER